MSVQVGPASENCQRSSCWLVQVSFVHLCDVDIGWVKAVENDLSCVSFCSSEIPTSSRMLLIPWLARSTPLRHPMLTWMFQVRQPASSVPSFLIALRVQNSLTLARNTSFIAFVCMLYGIIQAICQCHCVSNLPPGIPHRTLQTDAGGQYTIR